MFDGKVCASNIISLPLAFVRSGNVALYGGEVYAVGNNLYSGSRTARSASDVYYLGVAPTEVYLSGYLDRWYGFPLRWPSNIISLPLAFVRSGWVDIGGGAASGVGRSLYGWSRVSKSATNAYVLYVAPTAVDPSSSGNRWHAFPLRCLCMLKGIWKYRISMSRVVVV